MTRTIGAWFVVVALTLTGCGNLDRGQEPAAPSEPAVSPRPAEAGERELAVEHDGLRRTALVHVPPSAEGLLPLVLVFHGGIGSGAKTAKTTGMSTVADREGFVVAYPDGVDNHWNDGRGSPHAQADDVGFVAALVNRLRTELPIDPDRVYATGASNGGMFTNRLACELPGTFAAVAPVVGGLAEPLAPGCAPDPAPAVLAIFGSADPLVPYGGGEVTVGLGGVVLGAQETAAHWASLNGCANAPVLISETDNNPDDGTSLRLERFEGCAQGRDVGLYTIVGGGHGWPGSAQGFRPELSGTPTAELDASAVIWEFFASH